MLIPVLIAVTVAVILITIILVVSGAKHNAKGSRAEKVANSVQKKGVSAVVKEYEKKLAHDPHNVEALSGLGSVYYDDGNWEKVWAIYKKLFELSSAHTEIDVAEVTRKWGIAGYNLKKYDEAINALMFSIKKEPNAYETNFFLGSALMETQVYDKAAYCFKKCKLIAPENNEVNKQLGLCLFKSQKYKDSLAYLKKALDVEPENKELLYDMAVAMKLRSTYSMRFFEVMSGQSKPLEITVPDLRKMFRLENKYDKINDFQRRVLKAAREELDRVSPYSFEYTPNFIGKNIVSYTFYPIFIAANQDEKLIEQEKRAKVTARLQLDNRIYEYLRISYGFTPIEINKNKKTLLEGQKRIVNFLDFIANLRPNAIKATNSKAYIIGAIQKTLQSADDIKNAKRQGSVYASSDNAIKDRTRQLVLAFSPK